MITYLDHNSNYIWRKLFHCPLKQEILQKLDVDPTDIFVQDTKCPFRRCESSLYRWRYNRCMVSFQMTCTRVSRFYIYPKSTNPWTPTDQLFQCVDPLPKASHVLSISIIHPGCDGFLNQIKYHWSQFLQLLLLHFILEDKFLGGKISAGGMGL